MPYAEKAVLKGCLKGGLRRESYKMTRTLSNQQYNMKHFHFNFIGQQLLELKVLDPDLFQDPQVHYLFQEVNHLQ